MLQIKNLIKTYRSKSSAPVKALDDVSITFPETGMVFVLGKSGSGKSTLLNVIGGLDDCDSGEFIIKGKSSKNFVGSDFDAYRNTFIGFIFQEYNVLDDFTVGANIGLALELQGKKATNAKINEILAKVDMLDFAKRKPNELSGGQKQRVAIARALVKDPEIIMADEPTGALDSNTGKQIFDTLKELSKTKLVIIVSHDRDFAEKYGDRVIEMMDGKIFSDITKHEVAAETLSTGIVKMGSNLLRIEQGYQLTAHDLELINEYLRSQSGEILVSGDKRINDGVRSSAGITENNCSSVFDNTNEARDVKLKDYDAKKTKFIRSRLPMKNALKIGSSGLGHKKFRLVCTIALSLVAFTLFGFADTLGSYDKHTAAVESIMDSHIQNASFSLKLKHTYEYPDDTYTNYYGAAMNEDDIKYLCEKTGIDFVPVFTGSSDPEWGGGMSITGNMIETDVISGDSAYTGTLYGLTAVGKEKVVDDLGYTLHGRMPENKDEIVITEFLYRELNLTGFKNREMNEEIKAGELTLEAGSKNSIIGKHLTLNLYGMEYTLTITGVVDTEFDYSRYSDYVPTASSTSNRGEDDTNVIVDMVMQLELANTLSYGFHGLGYVTQSRIDDFAKEMTHYNDMANVGTSMYWNFQAEDQNGNSYYFSRIARSSDVSVLGKVNFFDGRQNNTLGENEVLINREMLSDGKMFMDFSQKAQTTLETLGITSEIYGNHSVYSIINDRYSGSAECKNACDIFIKEVFGFELPESIVDTAVYSQILCMSYDTLQNLDTNEYSRMLIYVDVCNMYAENNEIFKSEEFYDRCIYKMYGDYETYEKWIERYSLIDAMNAYDSHLTYEENGKFFGGKSRQDYSVDAMVKLMSLSGQNPFEGVTFKITMWEYTNNGSNEIVKEYSQYKIVGFFEGGSRDLMVCDGIYALHDAYIAEQGYAKETVAPHAPGVYAFVIAPMPTDRATIEKLVALTYEEGGDIRFVLQNQVMDTLYGFNDFIEIGAKVFLYIGIGFAVFAALMMMNFISTSISYKRREIGILRAVGARSSDVFKIFFSEAAIIALITYILSVASTIAATMLVNTVLRNQGINVTIINFGIRQVVLMLLVNAAVAAIASFLPVWRIARRNPVDAIKNT